MRYLSRQRQVEEILKKSRQNSDDRITQKALEILDIETLMYLGSVDNNQVHNNGDIILDAIPEPHITNWNTAYKKAKEIITKTK